eukprot:s788_g8.t2
MLASFLCASQGEAPEVRSPAARSPVKHVPQLSLTGLRSSLQGSALMGLPPPEEPGHGADASLPPLPEAALQEGAAACKRRAQLCLIVPSAAPLFGSSIEGPGAGILRTMIAALLAALALGVAIGQEQNHKDDHVGPVDALCQSVKLPVLCDNMPAAATSSTKKKVDGCEVNPSSCCKDSTCGAFPGMGCWKQRGDTQCSGDELWPLPKVGKCQCLSGYCDNTDGKCKVTATFPGSSASTYTSFGRLYDADADEKVPAEVWGFIVQTFWAQVNSGKTAACHPMMCHKPCVGLCVLGISVILAALAAAAAAGCTSCDWLQSTRHRIRIAALRGRLLSEQTRGLRGNESNGTMPDPFKSETESPWPEDYFPELTITESQAKSGMEMVRYSGCRRCSEEAFCNYAQNPGCGGSATGGVVTFSNLRHAWGCPVKPVLSIPRSYVRDLDDLRAKPGTFQTLKQMLHSGFDTYRAHGHKGPVQQCIHFLGR